MKRLLLTILLCLSCSVGWCGIDFDGTDDALNLSSAVVTDEPFTIVAWFKADSVTGVQTLVSINGEVAGSGNDEFWRLFLFDDDVGAQTQDKSAGNCTGTNYSRTSTSIGIGEIHMAAAVFVDNNNWHSLLDGGSIAYDSATNCDVVATDTNVGVNVNEGIPEPFNGTIYDIQIYDRVVTVPELLNLYNSGIKRIACQDSNIVDYYELSDGAEGTSADGDTIKSICGSGGNDLTGDNGSGNDNLLWTSEETLSYP